MTTSSRRFVGIDVAKYKLDIAVLGEKKASQVGNDEVGIAKLIKMLEALKPQLIVVEATGGYQRAVVLGLYEAGLPVAMVNPARVRNFARAHGLLAKTDKLDAFNLAEFGNLAESALRQVGCSEIIYSSGSTDANIPLSQGLPAVCIGLAHSHNAHRLDEYLDTTYLPAGMKQLLLLTLAAAEL